MPMISVEAKRLIDQIDENDAALRERYERIVAERLGISLEAFKAKKVVQEKRKLKRPNVVRNTTGKNGVVKTTTPEVSKALYNGHFRRMNRPKRFSISSQSRYDHFDTAPCIFRSAFLCSDQP